MINRNYDSLYPELLRDAGAYTMLEKRLHSMLLHVFKSLKGMNAKCLYDIFSTTTEKNNHSWSQNSLIFGGHQSGPWGRAVDGQPWRAAGMDFWNKRHRFLAPIVSEFRQSGPWTACRDGPLGWTFETNGTASLCRLFQKSARAGRGRLAVTGHRDGLLKQTARIPGADCCRSSSERAVDGWPWRAAGMDFWNKRHGFLAPIVAEVRQSGPWEQAVEGRPWRTAEMNFWNKRHGFLALIVSKVCQIGPCMLTKLTMFISRNPIEIQWVSRK